MGKTPTRWLLLAGLVGPSLFVGLAVCLKRVWVGATWAPRLVVVAGLGLPAAIAIAARRAPGKRARVWAPYSFASAIVMVGAWLATFAVPDADAGLAVAGRLQRVAIIAGFQWLVATALIELGRLDRATSPVYG